MATNNKRIAKNTVMLYFRMLFIMGITLYTSRVILNILGVQDYGIYNLVGGIIVLFNFVSSSLSVATQRFITFEIGKQSEGSVSEVFSTCLILHVVLGIILIIVAEPIGIWVINNKLSIPIERLDASLWIFQFSIVSMFIMIIYIPYNALIVAYERMSAFAYISIVEAVLKLLIVYILTLFDYDRLITYGALMLTVQLTIRFLYTLYCNHYLSEVKFTWRIQKKTVKTISSFAGSSVLGNISYISYTQGLNIMLGMFYLPVVNAARGIAMQVQGAVLSFVSSFQTAINPQITKTYAVGDLKDMHDLIFRSSRFSFYLLMCVTLPLILETSTVLKLWLGMVPDYTVIFVRLILLTTWINSIANPLIVSVKASGKVWQYESVVAVILLLILPISFVFLYIGFDAWIVFVVHLIMEVVAQTARITISSRLVGFLLHDYIELVLMKILYTCFVGSLIPLILYWCLPEGMATFFIISVVSVLSSIISVYFVGLTKEEIYYFNNKLLSLLRKAAQIN